MDTEPSFYYCLIDQVLFQERKNSNVFYPYIVPSFSRSVKIYLSMLYSVQYCMSMVFKLFKRGREIIEEI